MKDLELDQYVILLNGLKEKIRTARLRAALNVNTELLLLYWEIGRIIHEQEIQEKWGAKTVERLAVDLNTEFTDMKGLSKRNLRYMRDFAIAYPEFSILQHGAAKLQLTDFQENAGITKQQAILLQNAAKLPWGHHQLILDKVKSKEHRYFYITKAVTEQWNRAVLTLQINSELYERNGKAISNFSNTLPAIDSDLAIETFKNPYVFDFLTLGEQAKEKDFERALIQHLKKFMLELGKGFAYVGNQYNLNLDGDDYFLDLLFFNYKLNRFVIFELKIGEFKPEFAGKLNFYINAVNDQICEMHHKPTIGVLLCKTPNDSVVKLSLSGIEQPMGVSDYQLAEAIPKELKGEMPSIEELEAEIEKEYDELKSPTQKRLELLKAKIAQLNKDGIQKEGTLEDHCEIVHKSLHPLFVELLKRLEEFNTYFTGAKYHWYYNNGIISSLQDFSIKWCETEFINTNPRLYFNYHLQGFKKAGVGSFDTIIQIHYERAPHYYGITILNYNNHQPLIKKMYHQQLAQADIQNICDVACDYIVDNIERGIERIEKE